MGGANGNWRKYSRGALKQKAAGHFSQKGADLGDNVVVDPFRMQREAKSVSVNIVKATFKVKE